MNKLSQRQGKARQLNLKSAIFSQGKRSCLRHTYMYMYMYMYSTYVSMRSDHDLHSLLAHVLLLLKYMCMYTCIHVPAVSVQVTHIIPASVAIIRGLSRSPMALWLCLTEMVISTLYCSSCEQVSHLHHRRHSLVASVVIATVPMNCHAAS